MTKNVNISAFRGLRTPKVLYQRVGAGPVLAGGCRELRRPWNENGPSQKSHWVHVKGVARLYLPPLFRINPSV